MGAVGEVNAVDRGIDAGLDGDAGDGGDASERVEPHRHLLADRLADLDRHHMGALALRAGSRCAVAGPEAAGKHSNADQGERRHPK